MENKISKGVKESEELVEEKGLNKQGVFRQGEVEALLPRPSPQVELPEEARCQKLHIV